MLKLTDILKEIQESEDSRNRRAVQISLPVAWQALQTRFSEACSLYAKNPEWGLYRGYSMTGNRDRLYRKIFYLDPKQKVRVSKEANNFYTEWISKSPKWSEYPPRDKAVIASFDEEVAGDYGTIIFLVVPENGARFAIAQNTDLWGAFTYGGRTVAIGKDDVAGVNEIISAIALFFAEVATILELTDIKKRPYEVEDQMEKAQQFVDMADSHHSQIIANIDKISENINYSATLPDFKKKRLQTFIDYLLRNRNMSFRELFDDMFDPVKNKIDLVHGIRDLYGKYLHANFEFWTDAECLLIPQEFNDPHDTQSIPVPGHFNIFQRVMRGEDPL